MAYILIDGYNLIGIQHGNVEAERTRLVTALSTYARLRGHDITVVFDGWRGGGARATRQSIGGVEVIYSPLGQKADDLMAEMMAATRTSWIVVSSDREVEASAWAEESVPVGSEAFAKILERAIGRSAAGGDTGSVAKDAGGMSEHDMYDQYLGGGDYEPDDDEYNERLYAEPRRKGNPFKPSRKQKAIDRALAKL